MGWVIVIAAICSSCAHQPASNTSVASVKAMEASNYTLGENCTIALPNAVTLDLVWIIPGTFTMGTSYSEDDSDKLAHLHEYDPGSRFRNIGFRVALAPSR